MTNLARFKINGTASSPGGFDTTAGQTLTLQLEALSSATRRVSFQVYDPNDETSPLASKAAPLLTLLGATSGSRVDAATPGASVTVTMPVTGAHSWIVRCYVNDGLDDKERPSSDYVFERIISIRGGGRRKIIASEGTQYSKGGWADAQNDDVDAGGGGGSGGYVTVQDEGSALPSRSVMNFVGPGVTVTDVGGITQVSVPTQAPTPGAAGQVQVSNGSAWVSGPVDLADPDARTGTLPVANGGTGLSSAGGVANRVMQTLDGATFTMGQVALATMVSGLLALSNLTGGTAVGQVLRNTAGNVPAWGAVDVADPDAVTGQLPIANMSDLAGVSVLGRASSSSGVMAAITSSAEGDVLRRSGSAIGFGSLVKTSITPNVETSGSPWALKITGAAHTSLAASTQAPDVDLVLARQVEFSTGALASQRAVRITAPTYKFVGASTITDAATVAISAAPTAGTNATITRAYALWVESGVARFDGGIAFSGAGCATSGTLRAGTLFQIVANNGTTDLNVLAYDQSNNRITIGSANLAGSGMNGYIYLDTGVHLRVGTNSIVDVDTTKALLLPTTNPRWTIVANASGGAFTQEANGSNGGVGNPLTFAAQSTTNVNSTAGQGIFTGGFNTGTGTAGAGLFQGGDATGGSGTRNGGDTTWRSGTGATADGNAYAQRGATIQIQLVKPSSGYVIGLARTSQITATQMPANSGDGVVFLGTATTAPLSSVVPVGGTIIYAGAGGEFCTVSTDNTNLTMKLGDGSRGIELKSGGATVPGIKLNVNNGNAFYQFDDGLFDCSPQGTADQALAYKGTSVLKWNNLKLGFFGGVAQSKPTVSGSRTGGGSSSAAPALTSVISALNTLGLLTDSSSP